VQGRIQAARGDQAALSILDRAAGYAAQTAELQRIGPVAAARAEYHLLAGEPDRAAAAVAAALELAVAKRSPSFAARLAHLHWRATGEFPVTDPSPYRTLAEGDWAAAAAAFGAGGRHYARIVALSTGDSAAAAEALARLADLGADRAVAHLRAELKQRGLDGLPRGPRRTTAANPAGLTARQLEILRLLADGLTNADIAQRLTLSHRTVEHHVTATLEKLGARRRGEAVAAARRLGVLA
jgi:DNA-binding CsgD family transcriptional regulator